MTPGDYDPRERAVQSFRVLNGFTLDLTTGARAWDILAGTLDLERGPSVALGLHRMVMGHLIVSLNKWLEFYEKFLAVIPEDCRAEALRIKHDVERRRVREFRHKVVGHIWDDDLHRPLEMAEVNALFEAVVGDDPELFLRWVSSHDRADTVVSFVDRLKDRLREDYQLTNDELFPADEGAPSPRSAGNQRETEGPVLGPNDGTEDNHLVS
ncbi:MAG: hypothetical protein ACREX3_18425 [Gammaproteobacteria bacterium]